MTSYNSRGFPIPFASPFVSLRSPPRALPTETKVESGTSQSKSGTSVNLSNSGYRARRVGPIVLDDHGRPVNAPIRLYWVLGFGFCWGLDFIGFWVYWVSGWVLGFGSRVSGFRFWGLDLGFRGSGFGVWISGFGVQVLGFGSRVSGFSFWGSGFGFGVSGCGLWVVGSGVRDCLLVSTDSVPLSYVGPFSPSPPLPKTSSQSPREVP